MLSILCPHCETRLTVEEQWRGKTVNCLSCGQKMAVPTAATTVPPLVEEPPAVVTSRSTTLLRRRKKALGNRVITALLHISITAATVYAGYYLVTEYRPVPDSPSVVRVNPSIRPERTEPPVPVAARPEPIAPLAHPTTPEPVAAPELKPVEPETSPFTDAPPTVDLPAANDPGELTLVTGLPDTSEVQFLTNSVALQHEGENVLWTKNEEPVTVAGFTLGAGELVFRWLETVSEEAESAVRNSIVRIESGDFVHHVALRQPNYVQPQEIDLNDPLQRIISKCESLPRLEDVYFALTGIHELPDATVEGTDPGRMRMREQTILKYTTAEGAATRLRMKKQGSLLAIEWENRYVLPSGDKHPLTIERGNTKFQELAARHEEVQSAEKALPNLRKQLKDLQNESRAVSRARVTAAEKSVRLRELQQGILATQRQIQYAQQLIRQKPSITAEHAAIQQIAELAQQLHERKVAYRFYTVVAGHEVDLLVAE